MPRVAERPHSVEQLVEQGAVHARRGLVEQDQLGIGHEDADELHELLLAIGEVARELAGELLELDEAQELEGAPRASRERVVVTTRRFSSAVSSGNTRMI